MNPAAKPATHFRAIAFVVLPVHDVKASRLFYEDVLGLAVTKQWDNDWVEYDIGDGTLAITKADDGHQPGRHGPTLALEVTDLPGLVTALRAMAVPFAMEPFDSPACGGCVICDPDGNEILLHARR